jgi:hypothetical protein
MPINTEDGPVKIAMINFGKKEDTELFFSLMKSVKREQILIWKTSDKELILVESSSKSTVSDNYFKVVEDYIK